MAFPYIRDVHWLMGGATLVIVAVLLRRILHMGPLGKVHGGGMEFLRGDLRAIYDPVAQEIETHTTILGITLNEAFGERDAGRHQMAWHIVRLAVGEWKRLSEVLSGLLDALSKSLPATNGIVPVRRVAVGHFKSRVVMDNIGLYEFLDQVLFRSKPRFALQLHLLSRVNTVLSREFKHACREGEITLDSSPELWDQLDFFFHDFDLIAKETLLAFRTLLSCQSPEGAQALALDLQALLDRGIRVSVSPSNQ